MLEKNIFVPNLEMHPINQTIFNAVNILKRQAELQTITILFTPLDTELIAKIDQLRTQQVIINLLTNALKFSKARDLIRVVANIETASQVSNEISFVVKIIDTGIGISDQDLKYLFKPFFRS